MCISCLRHVDVHRVVYSFEYIASSSSHAGACGQREELKNLDFLGES